jgi:hypothetical protein
MQRIQSFLGESVAKPKAGLCNAFACNELNALQVVGTRCGYG